jgi:BRCA1-associated protein
MLLQVLRREGTQPSVCMVLLSFAGQEQADSFYGDFNGLPFSSLEPDILCRCGAGWLQLICGVGSSLL